MCCVGIKSRTRGALSGSVPEGERLQQVLWNIYAWASSCFLGPILYISLCVSVYVVVCVHTEGNKEGRAVVSFYCYCCSTSHCGNVPMTIPTGLHDFITVHNIPWCGLTPFSWSSLMNSLLLIYFYYKTSYDALICKCTVVPSFKFLWNWFIDV